MPLWVLENDWWILTGLVGFVVVVTVYCVVIDGKENERLMQQCLRDHKEYECVAMLRRHYKVIGKTVIED